MDDLTFRKRIYANPHDNAQDIIDACNDDKAIRPVRMRLYGL